MRPPAIALAVALAVPSIAQAEPRAEPTRHDTAAVDFLGAGYDYGARGSSLALGYVRAREEWTGRGGLGFGAWIGYGAEARILTQRFDAVDGAFGFAVGRASMMGDAGGAGVELALGGGSAGRGAQLAGEVGVYWSAYYVEIGYAYTAPLAPMARPDAMATHQLSVRVHVPLRRSQRRTRFDAVAE